MGSTSSQDKNRNIFWTTNLTNDTNYLSFGNTLHEADDTVFDFSAGDVLVGQPDEG